MSASTWPPDGRAEDNNGAGPGGEVAAAVLAPLILGGGEDTPRLVLTRRRADLRRHAGEISFPGGRRDDQDPDLLATALREAEEEIGLPRGEVTVVGELPPVSTFVTGYRIHPFVGTLPSTRAWTPSDAEVDEVLELTLAEVSSGRTRIRLERRGIMFETDAYVVGEHTIWGATARIIEHLLERLDSDERGLLTLPPLRAGATPSS